MPRPGCPSCCAPAPWRRHPSSRSSNRPPSPPGRADRLTRRALLTQSPPAPLSSNEAVTLRRVAFGQSDASTLRPQDLARLRVLKLIEGSAREPTLTADGKRCFDALPKAATLTDF